MSNEYWKFCKLTIKSEITVLKNYALSKKHNSIMLSGHKRQPPISMFITKTDTEIKKKQLVPIHC